MKIFLTTIFAFLWANNLTLLYDKGDNVFFLMLEGLTVIIGGVYWWVQDIKMAFGEL